MDQEGIVFSIYTTSKKAHSHPSFDRDAFG